MLVDRAAWVPLGLSAAVALGGCRDFSEMLPLEPHPGGAGGALERGGPGAGDAMGRRAARDDAAGGAGHDTESKPERFATNEDGVAEEDGTSRAAAVTPPEGGAIAAEDSSAANHRSDESGATAIVGAEEPPAALPAGGVLVPDSPLGNGASRIPAARKGDAGAVDAGTTDGGGAFAPQDADADAVDECAEPGCSCEHGGSWEGVSCRCPPRYRGERCESTRYVQIAAGKFHSCALRGDGSVLCWGNDQFAQVSGAPQGAGFRQLVSGGVVSCALDGDGLAACWGSNAQSVLNVVPERFEALAMGWDAACGRTATGSYDCWGSDEAGKRSGRPEEPVLDFAIGWMQGCAIRLDGSLDCWGNDEQGQASPPPGRDFQSLSLASWHGCAVREGGSLECWGNVPQPPVEPVRAVSSRGLDSCAVMLDSSVRCWGSGLPVDPPDIVAEQVAVGDGHACALLRSGDILCWGNSQWGATTPPKE